MSNRLLAVLAVAAVLGLASCGAPSTPDFVRKIAMSDLYEIQAGKVASEKGQSEAVKQFGRLMVEVHGKLNEELKSIVEAEKLDVRMPAELNRRRQKLIKALEKAKPEDFDALYVEQEVRVHDLTAGLLDDYAEEGGNDALKQFAANTLPIVKQHRQEAEALPH